MVRSVPKPSKRILASETRLVFDEVADKTKSVSIVSISPTVTLMALVVVSLYPFCSVMSEIVGSSLTAAIVTVTVAVSESIVPSFALKVNVSVPLALEFGV